MVNGIRLPPRRRLQRNGFYGTYETYELKRGQAAQRLPSAVPGRCDAAAGPTVWRDRVLAISDSRSPVQTRLSDLAYVNGADPFAEREDARPPGWLNSLC
jgi:hypothetical protein